MLSTFIPYARQSISEADCAAVLRALQAEVITRGAYVEQFEHAVASFCQAKYAVSFNSGTTALHAAYFAADAAPSSRVITTPNTFVGTLTGAVHLGSEIHFADIDRESGNLNLHQMASLLCHTHTVLVPVHFSGIPVNIEALRGKAPDAIIIEDAAHALGGYDGRGLPIGSCCASDMTVFSFHPAKTITTGEGGMVTTNNEKMVEKLRLFRNNGIIRSNAPHLFPGHYEVHHISGNYHLTDFQAALGLSQLERARAFVEKRRQLVGIYRECLEGQPHIRFFSPEHDRLSAHHLCVVQIDFEALGKERCQVMQALRRQNIMTQVHYIPLYRHPPFLGMAPLPEMDLYYAQALTLPLYVDLEVATVSSIAAHLLNTLYSS